MQDTPAPSFFAALNAQERAPLFTDAHVRTLPAAFASLPDPRKQRGQRDDLPFLLTCLAAALLCDCNSLEAVGRWTRDQQAVLARVCGPRRHLTPTGSLYRRLLPRLSVAHVERALASWVPQTRPLRDREPLAFDGKTVRGARTEAQAPPPSSQSPPTPRTRRWSRCAWTTRPTRSPWPKTSCPRCPCAAGSSPPTPCRPNPPWLSLSWTRAATTCSRSRTTSRACTPNWRPILPIRRPPAAPPTPWIATGAAPRRARSAPAPG